MPFPVPLVTIPRKNLFYFPVLSFFKVYFDSPRKLHLVILYIYLSCFNQITSLYCLASLLFNRATVHSIILSSYIDRKFQYFLLSNILFPTPASWQTHQYNLISFYKEMREKERERERDWEWEWMRLKDF
jgi:hypothetical protein